MAVASVGPGGSEVGPGGGQVGPLFDAVPAGVIGLVGAGPTPPIVRRAIVGPAGGLVGPAGGEVGPDAGYALEIPAGVIGLVAAAYIPQLVPAGTIGLVAQARVPPYVEILCGNGGWAEIIDPHAFTHRDPTGDKTFYGFLLNTDDTQLWVASYDHRTGQCSTPTQVATGLVSPSGNIHNTVSIIVRQSDNRLVIAICNEGGEPQIRISTNPLDETAWDAPITPFSGVYTYASLAQISAEPNTIYLWGTHWVSGTGRLGYAKSTDDGATWSAYTDVVKPTSTQVVFHKLATNWVDRMDIFVTDTQMDLAVPSSVYHFKMTAGGLVFRTDGTAIGAAKPFTAGNASLVQDSADGPARPLGGAYDSAGRPAAVLNVRPAGDATNPELIRAARSDDAGSWSVYPVADSNGPIIYGTTIEENDPNTIYADRYIDGADQPQIFRYRSFDEGITWPEQTQITDWALVAIIPVSVARATSLRVIWYGYDTDPPVEYSELIIGGWIDGTTTATAPPGAELHQLFDISDLASAELHQLFDMQGPPPAAELHQLFDLVGLTGAALHQPFDIEGPVSAALHQLFDIRSTVVSEVQTIVSGGVVTSYALTFAGQSTGAIAGTANAAAVQAALEALSNLAPGDVVVTGGPLNTDDLVITFGGTYAGVDVPQITVEATGATGSSPLGTTTTNGGPSAIGGSAIAGIPLLWLPMMVFDKGGNYLGSLTQFNVTNPPVRYLRSLRVTNEGSMTFNVSRHSPEIALIEDDRLVRLQSLQGEKPWWGTMSHQISARGIVEVVCKDPFNLLRDGDPIVLEEDVNDDTPATGVFAKIMGLHNDIRAATGEATWELDLAGAKPFRGDIDFDQDTLACLDTIMTRSRTEIAWDSRLEGNRLVPILRVRDRFDVAGGADILDGPDGNVTAGVQVIRDPQPLVFSIKLRGISTDLAKCLPEWAQWALEDVIPEVVVSVDPGAHRNRQQLTESMDWGLSKAAQQAMCNAIIDWLTDLYHSFLRAVHDIEGRPWHEGWAFVGPPDQYEPKTNGKDSLSRRAWTNRLQLVEVRPNEPASAVMLSAEPIVINLREWLIVRYNRVTGVQNVTTWAIPSVTGVSLVKWTSAGDITLYRVSGGRVVEKDTLPATGAFVDPYNTRIYDPFSRRYRWLRRIINGPFALAYYIDPGDAANSFVDLGADAAISTVDGDGSSLISKVYPFEALAIENWDPRRDGIGARKTGPTIFFGRVTTRPRWHITSFNVGGDANTSLVAGISSGDTDFEVESIYGFPDPDLDADQFPFLIAIDDGLDEEQVLVLSMTGALWHVIRGQAGTDAIIHEAGAPVRRVGVDAWDGFPWPAELLEWPEGRQWAEEKLAELAKPRIDLDVHIAHFRGDQLTIDYGSMHDVDVATEGPPARWSGTGRVIGWSTDPGYTPSADDPTPPGGDTEVVLEWQQ